MRLVLDEYGSFLGVKSNRFKVSQKGKVVKEVSSDKVKQIMIFGRGVSVSSDAIALANIKNVEILFLAKYGKPLSRLLPLKFSGTVKTRREQYLAYEDRRSVELAKSFIEGKIRNQAYLLRSYAKYRLRAKKETGEVLYNASYSVEAHLKELKEIKGRKIDQVRNNIFNVEARAASIYWQEMDKVFGYDFLTRDKPRSKDPVNAMLNYGYAILESEVWKSVLYAGLDPYAGFLHADKPGKASMIYDMMEEFRAQVVDRAVVNLSNTLKETSFEEKDEMLFLKKDARNAVFQEVQKRLNTRVKFRGKNLLIRNIVLKQARRIPMFLRENKKYTPFFLRW